MKKLIPLDQHNKSNSVCFTLAEYPIPNGIECPMCESEMGDSDGMVLTSNPPQKKIQCLNKECGYTTYAKY